jgi:hypothetical protein
MMLSSMRMKDHMDYGLEGATGTSFPLMMSGTITDGNSLISRDGNPDCDVSTVRSHHGHKHLVISTVTIG